MTLFYMVLDFILDQMEKIENLKEMQEKAKTKEKKLEISGQIEYAYYQASQVVKEPFVPKCVRRYFLKGGEKPTYEQISKEMERKFFLNRPLKKEQLTIPVLLIIIVLTILAILW